MNKKFDFQPILWVIIIAFAAFVSSCASQDARPYNSVVLGIHSIDSTQGLNKSEFMRVEYYTAYTSQADFTTGVDSILNIQSRVFLYKSAIEYFCVFPDGDVIHQTTKGEWLDEFTFRSYDGLEYYIFNEEYLDVTSDSFHFELIK